jgi:pimeloyl-ACP methyl ester carboxylesterase
MKPGISSKWIVGLIAIGFLSPTFGAEHEVKPEPAGDYVFLLHGLGRGAWSMKRLEWQLQKENYRVINVSYPSTRLSIQESANWLDNIVKEHASSCTGKIHFVTHSLGGIVVRQYLANRKLSGLGRVVMLAPPNQGSELAEKFRNNFLYRHFAGPSGQQLGVELGGLPARWPKLDYDVGVIAGNRSLNPLFSAWIPGRDDGKVSVQSTRLDGMRDFRVVHHTHTWLAWSRDVIGDTVRFLRTGQF